jgi:chemotaxis protein MotA
MDLATFIGFLGSTAIILLSIYLGGSSSDFVNTPSVLIVVMGTMAVTLMKFPLRKFILSFGMATRAFFHKEQTNSELIEEILALSRTVKKEGPLALEKQKVSNMFLAKGVRMIVDGYKPNIIRMMLEKEIALTIEQQNIGRSLFKSIGTVAPAMGMIGTLVGLIQMLANMDDPKTIGPSMAIALLTTLYGAVIANAFALPIADKLGYRIREETTQRRLIIESVVAIHSGVNTLMLEEMLNAYLIGDEKAAKKA